MTEPKLPQLSLEQSTDLDKLRETASARAAAEALARKRAEPERLRKEQERIDTKKMLDAIESKENKCINFADNFLKLLRAPKEKEVEKSITSWEWVDMQYVKRQTVEDIPRTPLVKISKNNKKRQAYYVYVKDNTHREDNYRGTNVEGYPIDGYEWQEHDSYSVCVVVSAGIRQEELALLNSEEKASLKTLGRTLGGDSVVGVDLAEHVFGDTKNRDKIETLKEAQAYCKAIEEVYIFITLMKTCLANARLNPVRGIGISALLECSASKVE